MIANYESSVTKSGVRGLNVEKMSKIIVVQNLIKRLHAKFHKYTGNYKKIFYSSVFTIYCEIVK